LRIRLFGPLGLGLDGDPLPALASARAESLLGYLLVHRDAPQPRGHLAFLLWPDSSEAQARTNLRHVLHVLRRDLPSADRLLEVTQRTLRWRGDRSCWVDLAAYEETLAKARCHGDDEVAALREAAGLYAGDLLEGCYDDWVGPERDRLRRRHVEALDRLVGLLEERRDHREAIRYAESLLERDPLHEQTYQRLMRLYDALGDRPRALRVYHACLTALDRELGVEPSASTRAAYQTLLPADRFDGEARQERTPLVGRAGEWATLTACWREGEPGGARLVLVTGEAGVGKTRLADELRAWCAHRGAATASARSYAAEGALPYDPVAAWLRSDALYPHLRRLAPGHRGELARVLPELGPVDAEGGRQRLFEALAHAVLAPSVPVLLVADDMHLADRETLQFLHFLLRSRSDAALLVVATARLEGLDERHPLAELLAGLRALDQLVDVPLDRLTEEETAELGRHVARRAVDADELYRETEGNPLFIVEMVRAGTSSPKVQAVIESRLAALSDPAREIVAIASAIGREFTTGVLARARPHDLVAGLDELWRQRIVREQGADAYDFSHGKIRDVAYAALGPARRRDVHRRVADALLASGDPAPVAGQLAAHLERAGALDDAVAWYLRAGQAAQHMHAPYEAVRLLDRALAILRGLPPTADRTARELDVLAALPAPLIGIEGYASDRVARVQQRALDLARASGANPAPPLLRSVAMTRLSQEDFAGARELGEELCALGERDGDDVLVVEGEYIRGVAAFWTAAFDEARRHFEAAVARYRPENRRAHLVAYGQDPKVVASTRLAQALWFLGRADEAVRLRDEFVAYAEEVGHPYTRVVALQFAALLGIETGDADAVRRFVAELPATGQIAPQTQEEALRGYVDVLDGRPGGLDRIRRALDAAAEQRAPGTFPFVLRVLLAACERAGNATEGLIASERMLAAGGAAIVWEAEARRLREVFAGKRYGNAARAGSSP
jgi:DNA-binding SARP family transcriptional activator